MKCLNPQAILARLGRCSASTEPAGKESRLCSSFLALAFVGCKPPHQPSDSCRVVVPWPWADKTKAVCLMYLLELWVFTVKWTFISVLAGYRPPIAFSVPHFSLGFSVFDFSFLQILHYCYTCRFVGLFEHHMLVEIREMLHNKWWENHPEWRQARIFPLQMSLHFELEGKGHCNNKKLLQESNKDQPLVASNRVKVWG